MPPGRLKNELNGMDQKRDAEIAPNTRSSNTSLFWIAVGSVIIFLLYEDKLLTAFIENLNQPNPDPANLVPVQTSVQPPAIAWASILFLAIPFLAAFAGLWAALLCANIRSQAAIFTAYAYVVAMGLLGSQAGFPFSGSLWETIKELWLLGFVAICFALFGLWTGQLNALNNRVRRAIWGFGIAALLALALRMIWPEWPLAIVVTFLVPHLCLSLYWIIRHIQKNTRRAYLESAAAFPSWILMTLIVVSQFSPVDGTNLIFAPFPILVGGGAFMMHAVYSALRDNERWTDAVIVNQQRELERSSAALREETRKRILLEERDRLTRDVHDGIGSQLLSLLVLVRTKSVDSLEIEEQLQGSLHDLRLIVDSLDHGEDNFLSAMQSFRARIAPQLNAAGIRLEWKTNEDVLHQIQLDTRSVLNIYRFLQEAVTNCVRHANASQLTVEITSAHQTQLLIVVEDDGEGISVATDEHSGKGLANLRKRATALGGCVGVGAGRDEKGTRVELKIPIKRFDDNSSA